MTQRKSIKEELSKISNSVRNIFRAIRNSKIVTISRRLSPAVVSAITLTLSAALISLASSFAETKNCYILDSEYIGPPGFRPCHTIKDFLPLIKNYFLPWWGIILTTAAGLIAQLLIRKDISDYHKVTEKNEALKQEIITANKEIKTTNDRLREQINLHGATKSSYYDDLKKYFKFAIPLAKCAFDNSCRVSLYRSIEDRPDALKQVYRHAPRDNFRKDGRIIIPSDEGIVGLAWTEVDHVVVSFKKLHTSRGFKGEFETYLKTFHPGSKVRPPTRASQPSNMPSKSYLAIRLLSPKDKKPFSLLVFESVDENKFDGINIGDIIAVDLPSLIEPAYAMCALDQAFAPMGGHPNV